MYISFAMTDVLFAPAVMVRTMSNTFSEAIEIVVSTTMSDGTDAGNGHVDEPLPGVGAVELCGLELLGGHALDRRREHDHRESGLHPDQHDDEEQRVPRLDGEEVVRLAAEPDDDLVEEADLRLAPPGAPCT